MGAKGGAVLKQEVEPIELISADVGVMLPLSFGRDGPLSTGVISNAQDFLQCANTPLARNGPYIDYSVTECLD